MKTKLTLSIIILALVPLHAESADKKKAEHKEESFNWQQEMREQAHVEIFPTDE